MIMDQLNLPIGSARDTLDVEWFEHVVASHAGWVLGRQILTDAGQPAVDSTLRWLRRLAAVSHAIISGQRGYCHLDHATTDEIHHAAAWLESQAAEMQARAIRLRQAAHRRVA
jgi:hypothetical protein